MEQNNNTQTSTQSEDNINQHRKILEEMNELYARKNHDYGDSFHLLWEEEGIAMARIRLGDKFSRFKTLSRSNKEQQVMDESLRDTLIDLANYAIMTVMELDREITLLTKKTAILAQSCLTYFLRPYNPDSSTKYSLTIKEDVRLLN